MAVNQRSDLDSFGDEFSDVINVQVYSKTTSATPLENQLIGIR